MKKFFTLLTVAFMALNVNAKEEIDFSHLPFGTTVPLKATH